MTVTTMKPSSLIRFALYALVLSLLTSCGSEFRSAWRKPGTSGGVEGRWEGTWLSAANGHHGRLRCAVSAPTNAQGDHDFFYRATWKSVLSGSFKSIHHVHKKKDGTYVFKGDHQMPEWAGGKYHYEGTVKGDDFNACYESSMDRGTFTMKRIR